MEPREAGERTVHGLRTSILNNATAYGFSVMITLVLVAAQRSLEPPAMGELFLFAVGAASAFAVVEAVATSWFRVRVRPEPTQAVALGSAFAVVSVTVGLGAAILVLQSLSGRLAWFVAPFVATSTYVVASGAEMAVGRWRAEQMESEEEDEDPSDR